MKQKKLEIKTERVKIARTHREKDNGTLLYSDKKRIPTSVKKRAVAD